MKGTYKAVEVSAPGVLRVVERPVSEPGPGQVRVRVEACGICHTDAATVTGIYPGLTLPRVPGHEVVGRIEALGAGVSRWEIGQRVGVGLIGGEDGVCEPCRRVDIVNCQNPVVVGVTVDGGYAEVMIAEARGIASIPDELSSVDAAPLLCANPKGIYIMAGALSGRLIGFLAIPIKAACVVTVRESEVRRVHCESEQRGPDHHGRAHSDRKGNTGHRQALQVE
jgi:D-arabinose 1-dehydrogenase-like Zn-dependent alcohol dehydrogenase